jgi:hypothetical protein
VPAPKAEPKAAEPPAEKPAAQAPAEPGPNVQVPHEAPRPVALDRTEDPETVYQQVLREQLEKGSSPQVAEARAKVARVKAERGIKRGPTPIATEKMVPSAPTQGQPTEPAPSGAPEAKEPQPSQGPVAATTQEAQSAGGEDGESESVQAPAEPGSDGVNRGGTAAAPPPPTATGTEASGSEDPEAVYERVLAEEKAKGSSDAVATGRAKSARVKAERAAKGGG